jgi:hypothetical protein
MISLLIYLLILVVALGAAYAIVSLLPIPPNFIRIAHIVIAVIGFVALLYILLGLVDGGPALTLRR